MAISTPMMSMTTISSMSVKPDSDRLCLRIAIYLPIPLPVRILRAIERRSRRFGVHIEDTLAAIGIALGVVLHRVQSPLRLARHGIDRNPAQKLHLLALHIH